MRTGRFCFENHIPRRRWWQRRPAPVQILMIEVDEPIDSAGTRAVFWRPANRSDAHAIQTRLEGACCALKRLA